MFDKDKTAMVGSSKDPKFDEFSIQFKPNNVQTNSSPTPVIDETKSNLLQQQFRDNQNLTMGVVGGFGAAIIGAVVWALITSFTQYQIGFMAIGIGFLVGYAVRRMGQGVDPIFGYSGAGFSLLGCVLGNILTTCIITAQQEGVALSQVLAELNFTVAIEIMKFTFSPIDLIFYGLAIYYGYRLSFRQPTPDELNSISKPAGA